MRALALIATCLAVGSCSKTLKKVGEACAADEDCGSVLGGGEGANLCKEGVCTKLCATQLECPVGFDCGLQKPGEDTDATCYQAKWTAVMGGYATDCSKYSKGCSADEPNPCAAGFECLAAIKCDPAAYCTKACASDAECPPAMFCGEADGAKQCLKRQHCADCGADDQCPSSWLCITDARGGRHCARPCKKDEDCHQQKNVFYEPFEKCLADAGGKGKVCLPANSVCRGPSAVKSLGEFAVCSPCRPGVPSDCPKGGRCEIQEFTGEQFCVVDCKVKKNLTGDNCPKGSYCYPTKNDPNDTTAFLGFCQGNPERPSAQDPGQSPTCYPEK